MSIGNFKGFPYPVRKTATGILSPMSGLNQIKADLLVLLLTNPRERVMLPEFGVPLRRLEFNPNDAIVREEAYRMISDAISKEEPRVVIQGLQVESGRRSGSQDDSIDDDHVLHISIDMVDPENLKEIDSLKLQRPVGGA